MSQNNHFISIPFGFDEGLGTYRIRPWLSSSCDVPGCCLVVSGTHSIVDVSTPFSVAAAEVIEKTCCMMTDRVKDNSNAWQGTQGRNEAPRTF